MNFESDILEIAKTNLDHYRIPYTNLSDDRDILRRWINVKLHLIPPSQYIVQHSAEFQISPFRHQYQDVIKEIEQSFNNGLDVNKYLSKSSLDKNGFVDALFYDWRIHHFHLGKKDPNNYFVTRSDHLLFLLIDQLKVLFIDIRPHKEPFVFEQKALLDILVANWPTYMETFRIPAIDITATNSPQDIKKLRGAHINTIHKIGDKIYMPPGEGLTTAGSGVAVVRYEISLYSRAKQLSKWVENNKAQLASDLHISPDKMDLKFVLFNDGWDLYDKNTKTRIRTTPKP